MKVSVGPIDAIGGRFEVQDEQHAVQVPHVIPARLDDVTWDVTFTIEFADVGAPIVTDLHLRMKDGGGEPIAPTAVRGIRLGLVVRKAIELAAVPFERCGEGWASERRAAARDVRPLFARKRDTIDEEARSAAEIYRRVRALPGRHDVSAVVAKELNLSRPTAHRRIERARAIGHLEVGE